MHYLEDLQPGDRFEGGPRTVSEASINAFAAEYDPQPFHLDAEAARESMFEGLAASGWQTAAMTMRLMLESGLAPANGLVGIGVERLRFPRPVRPGDALRVQMDVTSVRRSDSRPGWGVVTMAVRTFNQHDEVVYECVPRCWVQARAATVPAQEAGQ